MQILSAQAAYEDTPAGQSRGNAVLLHLRTLPEFADGTRIDVNVTLSSDQHGATTTMPFYTGGSGPSLPDNGGTGGSSALPTSGTVEVNRTRPTKALSVP